MTFPEALIRQTFFSTSNLIPQFRHQSYGRVYNVTPYMEFHPGGEDELMKGAGRDGTSLFDEIHKWVNFESMLEKCLVGTLKTQIKISPVKGPRKPPDASNKINGFTTLAPPGPPAKPPPRYEWFQTESHVTVVVYTKWKDMKQENVIIDKDDRMLVLTLLILDHTFTIHLELENNVTDEYDVRALRPSGKVEIVLRKELIGHKWASIGQTLEKDKSYIPTKDAEMKYRRCKLVSKRDLNHDTRLFCIGLPPGSRLCVPVGFHVHVKGNVDGMEIVRSYTVVLPSLSADEQDRQVENGRAFYLMIKIYPSGALTPLLERLNVGDNVEVSSFTGDFVDSRLADCSHLVMYAAGTGFTPMVRLLYNTVVTQPEGTERTVHLSFFNKTEKDIIWGNQLDAIASKCQNFQIRHILSQADDTWTGPTGRVRRDLMEESIPAVREGRKILFCACGPTPFTKEAIRLAKELGYSVETVHAFLA